MLGSLWFWWRLTSAAITGAIVFFAAAGVSAFYVFGILQRQTADGLPIYLLLFSLALGSVFIVGWLAIAEALHAGERHAVRWPHLLRALTPPVALLALGYALSGTGFKLGPGFLLPLLVPIFIWRGKPAAEHPYAKARIFFHLWRQNVPPDLSVRSESKHRS